MAKLGQLLPKHDPSLIDWNAPIPAVLAAVRMPGVLKLLRQHRQLAIPAYVKHSSARFCADGTMVWRCDEEAALRLGRGGRPVPHRQLVTRQKGTRLLLQRGGSDRLDIRHCGNMLWEEVQIHEAGGAESAVDACVGAADRRYASTENAGPIHL